MGNIGYEKNHTHNKLLSKDKKSSHDSTCDRSTLNSNKAKELENSCSETKKVLHRFQWLGKGHTVYLVGNFRGDSSESVLQMTFIPKDRTFFIELVRIIGTYIK